MAVFPLSLFAGLMILALCTARQYIFVNENKTWTEAQSYCRDKYTDLVTIENDQEMEKLLDMMENYDSIDLTWIGLYDDLNSWKWTLEDSDFFKEGEKQFRNWYSPGPGNHGGQSLCVYIENGRWIAESCSTAYFFICYDGRVNASSSYVPVSQPKNWTEAQSYCRQHHSDLVSVRNESEHQKILYLSQMYYASWIGLYRTRSWSDQSSSTFSNWRSGEPNNAGNREYCTAVSFSDAGEWTDENCDYQLPFICYSVTALASSRQYHFISEKKSWSEAQTYCRQNYTDLATIDNMTEMNSVMNTLNGSYDGTAWIGLYDDVNSWRWSLDDDDFYQEGERTFRNWYHEPDNYRRNELCVYMSVNDGSWFDSSCDNILPFVCYDGRENATQTHIKVTVRKTWAEAQRYCRDHHTDLVNVRNLTENQRFIDSAGGLIWIGLNRNRIWSNHAISSYQNWRPDVSHYEVKRSVELMNSFQYCTAVSVHKLGHWTHESCFSNRFFFCYSTLASSRQYHFISVNKNWLEAQTYCRQNYTDLATIGNMTEMNRLMKTVRGINYGSVWIGQYDDLNNWRWSLGNTELGGGFNSWYVQQPKNAYGQSLCLSVSYQGIWQETFCSTMASFICYDGRQNASVSYVHVKDMKNWTEARNYCREHHTDLVSIRNETENQMIVSLLQNNYYGVWIGLYRTRSWSDQSNSTFSNWRSGEPNNAGDSEYCTAVSFSDAGEWTDENCDYQLPFICYNGSYLAISSRQFHFISEKKSWSEAQTYCRQNYTDLATIDNMTEMNSVMNTLNGSYDGSAWIGLYDDVNSWRWSLDDDDFYQEGERTFRNWYHQPDNYRGNELCVSMDVNDGTWFDARCDNSFIFVCYDGRENASQKYVWVGQEKTWSDAQTHCRQFYTDLASVRNETERIQILTVDQKFKITVERENNNVWIGLHRSKLWSDQSNSSFTYLVAWAYGEETSDFSFFGQAQQCTAVSFKSFGYWTHEQCFDHLPFFCYSEKYVSGWRVKFLGKENLSQSQIEEFIDQLKQELIRGGVPGNFTVRLRNYSKISSLFSRTR